MQRSPPGKMKQAKCSKDVLSKSKNRIKGQFGAKLIISLGNKIIASVHVKFHSNTDYNRLSPNLKEFFHSEGIHSTTFQPEVVEEEQGEMGGMKDFKKCLLACVRCVCFILYFLKGSCHNNIFFLEILKIFYHSFQLIWFHPGLNVAQFVKMRLVVLFYYILTYPAPAPF